MAPEVVERTVEGYDETVDWWSLGVIAFELLTGCSPFTVDGHSNTSRDVARWDFLINNLEQPKSHMKFTPRRYMEILLCYIQIYHSLSEEFWQNLYHFHEISINLLWILLIVCWKNQRDVVWAEMVLMKSRIIFSLLTLIGTGVNGVSWNHQLYRKFQTMWACLSGFHGMWLSN